MIGVVVLTFQSAEVIEACLDSLRASEHSDLRVVVCDNNSQDNTVTIVRHWASEKGIRLSEIDLGVSEQPDEPGFLTLVHTGGNLGFAGGVNRGITHLQADPRIDLFWILNPDSEATPGAAGAYARCAERIGRFSLMGGRIRYYEAPGYIQSDGGKVSVLSEFAATSMRA